MNLESIKKLREKTGAGILDCQNALKESQQNWDKALEWLKKRGLAQAEKKALRATNQGRISSYLHGDGRIGVLLEVSVETDFAGRSEDFKTFTHQLCLHITATNPLFIQREDIPQNIIDKEKALFKEQATREGKKPAIIDKIAEGRFNKWCAEVCLMEQIFLPTAQEDSPKTVAQSLKEKVALLRENILIRRFVRFEMGEEIKNNGYAFSLPSPLEKQ